MSRVGNEPITIPDGVEVNIDGNTIEVTGPDGSLSYTKPDRIDVEIEDGEIRFSRRDDRPESRSLHGTARSCTENLVEGVTEGYEKELEVRGVGYRAFLEGDTLKLEVGFSHPVEIEVPQNEYVTCEVPERDRIIFRGIDKQKVGHYACITRKVRPPEPYKGKGIRYKDEDVERKPGKAAVTTEGI